MWGAWCARCHAEDGSGTITEPTVSVEPMDFTDCKVTTPEPDADWERAIAKGGPGAAQMVDELVELMHKHNR